jgi:nitronate monooxygenase
MLLRQCKWPDLVYMVLAHHATESRAERLIGEMISESKVGDVVYTAAVSGVNANFTTKSEKNGITEDMWSQSKKILIL